MQMLRSTFPVSGLYIDALVNISSSLRLRNKPIHTAPDTLGFFRVSSATNHALGCTCIGRTNFAPEIQITTVGELVSVWICSIIWAYHALNWLITHNHHYKLNSVLLYPILLWQYYTVQVVLGLRKSIPKGSVLGMRTDLFGASARVFLLSKLTPACRSWIRPKLTFHESLF